MRVDHRLAYPISLSISGNLLQLNGCVLMDEEIDIEGKPTLLALGSEAMRTLLSLMPTETEMAVKWVILLQDLQGILSNDFCTLQIFAHALYDLMRS